MTPKEIIVLLFITCLAIIAFVSLCQREGCPDTIDDIVPFIIQVESGGDSNAISEDSCRGLMQISEVVFKEYLRDQCFFESTDKGFYYTDFTYISDNGYLIIVEGRVLELYNPKFNKHIGLWYLKRLRDHYLKENYTLERLLASYNGGITRMRRLLREGKDWQDMPRESVNYVHKVLKLYNPIDK